MDSGSVFSLVSHTNFSILSLNTYASHDHLAFVITLRSPLVYIMKEFENPIKLGNMQVVRKSSEFRHTGTLETLRLCRHTRIISGNVVVIHTWHGTIKRLVVGMAFFYHIYP